MSWMLFPSNPALSAIVLFLIALPFLYAARNPVHEAVGGLVRAVGGSLRLAARWLTGVADAMRSRNTVVLLAHAREEAAAAIEREFERVTLLVARDLNGYPALQRKLLDEITRVEEDYQKCNEVPPPPPNWTKAVETIAKLKDGGDGLAAKILNDIARSMDDIYAKVIAEYRRSYEDRHRILKGFMPFWRSLGATLTRVDRNLTGLQDSAARIDGLMEKYKDINAGAERVEQALTSSAATQFVIAAAVMVIALGGAFVNFWLIARPMAAMVGGGEYLAGGLEASHVAALVIILVEATMGLFLMESLRITHLFPRIHNMPDRMRQRLVWVSFSILLILAGVEVALAVMRDQIIAADVALKRGLGTTEAVALAELGWVTTIPVAGQMILGFVLPFALAFVAIPLEYFIYSARTVIGASVVGVLRLIAFGLRLTSGAMKQLGFVATKLYDAVIFLPILIEQAVRGRAGTGAAKRMLFKRPGEHGL